MCLKSHFCLLLYVMYSAVATSPHMVGIFIIPCFGHSLGRTSCSITALLSSLFPLWFFLKEHPWEGFMAISPVASGTELPLHSPLSPSLWLMRSRDSSTWFRNDLATQGFILFFRNGDSLEMQCATSWLSDISLFLCTQSLCYVCFSWHRRYLYRGEAGVKLKIWFYLKIEAKPNIFYSHLVVKSVV